MRRSNLMSLGVLVLIISLYTLSVRYIDSEKISTAVTTVTAIIGAYAIWYEWRKDSKIKQAEFMMGLNESFINNPKLVEIEHKLENYRKHGIQELGEEDRQSVIDYLVYHEGLAALYFRGVLNLDVIDDLFSYRFFLAMNNPWVQREELLPDMEYYRGCIMLYKIWHEYKVDRKKPILLENHSLHTLFEINLRKKRVEKVECAYYMNDVSLV